jgi:hypothetical protein
MGNDDSLYKRVDDQKWRDGVNDRLAALTASEVVQNDRLDEVDEEIRAVRAILEGKADDRNDNGIKGDIHELNVMLNQLRAIMAPDSLGQGGVINRLKALEKKAGIEELEITSRWKFKTAVVGALIAAVVAVLTNLDRIAPPLKKFWKQEVVSESKPPKKHSARTSRRRPRAAEIEVPEGTDGPQEVVPDRRSGDGSDNQ